MIDPVTDSEPLDAEGLPDAGFEEPDLMEDNVFLERVNSVYSKIQENPDNRDRVLAEIYVFMATMEQGIRRMIGSGGPMAMLSKMMGVKHE